MSKALSLALLAALGFVASPGEAVTLQQLSLDEMTQQSTAIVRGQVTSSSASFSGTTIYTHYRLKIMETLKGSFGGEVMVPGGTSGKYTQTFPGIPQLETGRDYLLFLWTSSAGITHLMGLSQGVFELSPTADGVLMATRRSIGELMLDKSGRQVRDQGAQVHLSELRGKLSAVKNTGGPVR